MQTMESVMKKIIGRITDSRAFSNTLTVFFGSFTYTVVDKEMRLGIETTDMLYTPLIICLIIIVFLWEPAR